MNSDMIRINQSPFYKEKHHEGKKDGKIPDARIPKALEDDLYYYFEENGLSLSDGIKQIVYEKMETINLERTCFYNVELIMLLPKTSNLDELNDKCEIIALYNTKSDFAESYEYNDGFDDHFQIFFDMKEFCEDYFPLEHLNMMKESMVFRVGFPEMMDWDSFSGKLSQLYPDLDMDNCYFIRFPLNNYMDIERQGQFQHPTHIGLHQGLYIFDEFGFRRFYLILKWRYDGFNLISFKYQFISIGQFMRIIKDSPHDDINDCLDYIVHSNHDKEEVKRLIDENESHGEFLKRLYDKM